MYSLDYIQAFERLLGYYYNDAPGRIMPLFLLYLARRDKNSVFIEEKIRKPLDWKKQPEDRYKSPVLSQFTKIDAKRLAITDPAGKHMLERWACNEMDHMSIIVIYEDERLQEIRSFFQKKDEALRDNTKTRKALFSFVQGLDRIPQDVLEEHYLVFANMILKRANVLDEMEDYHLAKFERWLIGEEVSGNVYVPQAKSPFAAATFEKATIHIESAGPNAKFDSMISYLLIHGNGCKEVSVSAVTKEFVEAQGKSYDLVIMNRAAHNRYNQHSDWHDCLKSIKGGLTEKGRFLGVVENKFLFAMMDNQKIFKESIRNKELEQIILLPRQYGVSLVSINKSKENPDIVNFVNLYNEAIVCEDESYIDDYYVDLLENNSFDVDIEEVKTKKLHSFFAYSLPEKEGFKLVSLRKYLRRITPSSSFCVSNAPQDDEISIIEIDRTIPYSEFRYILNSEYVDTFSLYHNYFYLNDCSLIVNKKGELEPYIYGEYEEDEDGYMAETIPAYIKDVITFSINKGDIYPPYIINELRKEYIKTQLNHWSCSPEGYHSEDEILDLKIYVPVSNSIISAERKICNNELDKNILPENFTVKNVKSGKNYNIIRSLGRGAFGITYLAREYDWRNHSSRLVALKEYLAVAMGDQISQRDDQQRVSITLGNITSLRKEWNVFVYLLKFIDEAELMKKFGRFPGCRIIPSSDLFKYDVTNTYYNVMECCVNGSLKDELEKRKRLPEKEAIERIILPLARAVKTMHDNRWLHLDIKAENVLIDDNGYAMLGDLGIAQNWDENGNRVTKGASRVGSEGASLKQKEGDKKFDLEFHPEQDVYSLAVLYYQILTGRQGKESHWYFSKEDLDFYDYISDASKEAISAALTNGDTLESTPKNVLDFIHMLPGCEEIELPEIVPNEEPQSCFNLDFLPECPGSSY